MDEMKPQKQVVIEKTLNFDYMLLILCVLAFINMSLIIFIRKPITQLSISLVVNNISIGLILIAFAAFCFLMAFIYPVLYRLASDLLFPVMLDVRYLIKKLSHGKKNGISGYANRKLALSVELLAIKTNNSTLMSYCAKKISENDKAEKIAFLSSSLLLTLSLDTIVSTKCDAFSSSFLYIVASFGGRISGEASVFICIMIVVFIICLIWYAFCPNDSIGEVYIPKDIWASLDKKGNKSQAGIPKNQPSELQRSSFQ